jgi:hypothetical protein
VADWHIEGVARQYEGGRERRAGASQGVRFEIRETSSGRSKTVRVEAPPGVTLSEQEARAALIAHLRDEEPPESIVVRSP